MKRIRVNYVDQGAIGDHTYRYCLWRVWAPVAPKMMYVMLNPSTADAATDDDTIEQCVHFAARDGFGSIAVVNLFAYRATNPDAIKKLRNKESAIGPDNLRYNERELRRTDLIVLAWGAHGSTYGRHLDDDVRLLCKQYDVYCLGKTKDGHPRHPLRLPLDTRFERYIYPFE
jgi:hypothetical protein